MAKLTKRIVDAADVREKDYFIWDDELPGFGLRVFASGKRSYLIQYRAVGRTRRYTIGLHGVWTPETARQEAKVQLGRVARGDNPSEERQLDHKAITVKELCALYTADLNAGLILGKGGRPKKPTTIVTDTGRIERHIIPLIGARRVKDLTKADINKVLKDIMAGKTRVAVKTKKLRGKAIVRGGAGTATRTVGRYTPNGFAGGGSFSPSAAMRVSGEAVHASSGGGAASGSTSTMISISTAMPCEGSEPIPTAERTPTPADAPKTSRISSLYPLATPMCSTK